MQHPDDDLLAHEAALAERDRALLDTCLERNRLVRHVHAEHRVTGLDTRGSQRLLRMGGAGDQPVGMINAEVRGAMHEAFRQVNARRA